jgi:hypothetical protein
MFKAAYTTDFYRAVRDALHAEVDLWRDPPVQGASSVRVEDLWQKIAELEPLARTEDAFTFRAPVHVLTSWSIVPVEQLTSFRKT